MFILIILLCKCNLILLLTITQTTRITTQKLIIGGLFSGVWLKCKSWFKELGCCKLDGYCLIHWYFQLEGIKILILAQKMEIQAIWTRMQLKMLFWTLQIWFQLGRLKLLMISTTNSFNHQWVFSFPKFQFSNI